ncbi:MAG: DHH family phosphoesterase [Desulfobacca sp.]|uniref:DHH family phosphoesterase n=1 Tax=Desulfobacca sp. TaxID=2067990 RepID=UPI00404A2AA0
MKDRLRRLRQLFHQQDRLLILIDADPDSIASALALKRLLWRRLTACTISPIRAITRPQNQTMVRLLEIPLTPFDQIQRDNFNRFALVDSQPSHNPLFAEFSYDVIIDHHPLMPQSEAHFLDVRTGYGSNSTIMTEYLRLAKITPSMKLATALSYAIKTDTHNFERPSIEADIRAFHYLFRYTRHALLRRIEIAELTLEMLQYFQLGLNRRQRRRERVYCFVGRVPNPDILVILAEFFLRVIEITWSFVGGIYDNRLIVIFRNDGIRKNAGKLAANAFGRLGSAGGHAASARAEIPLEHLNHLPPPEDISAWENFLISQIEQS